MPRLTHASPQTLRLFEALLAEPARWRYGYDLSRETGLASGTLYPILMRLSGQHLLDAGWEASEEPGRPPRHTYRLTADGIVLARERLAAVARKQHGQAAAFIPRGGLMRRAARTVLVAAVRGRRARGGPWGEAALAEFDQTTGRWEAVRWAAGGLRTVWHERQARIKALPRGVRVQRAMIGVALLALPVAVVVNQFALTARYVASGAMEPTMLISDRFLVDKVTFRLTGFERGDIVEFALPDALGTTFVKRVIGLPGDTIECRAGTVYRDGVALDEPYVETPAMTLECGPRLTVPAGELFVLGDHRELSRDSRQWGTIPQKEVDGRLVSRIWPLT